MTDIKAEIAIEGLLAAVEDMEAGAVPEEYLHKNVEVDSGPDKRTIKVTYTPPRGTN